MTTFKLGYYCTAGNRWPGGPGDSGGWTDLDVYLWRQFDADGNDRGLINLLYAYLVP